MKSPLVTQPAIKLKCIYSRHTLKQLTVIDEYLTKGSRNLKKKPTNNKTPRCTLRPFKAPNALIVAYEL